MVRGIIYQISEVTTDKTAKPKVYIGSTIRSIETRLSQHENDYRRHLSGERVSMTSSFEVLQGGNYKIQELDDLDGDEEEHMYLSDRQFLAKLRDMERRYIGYRIMEDETKVMRVPKKQTKKHK